MGHQTKVRELLEKEKERRNQMRMGKVRIHNEYIVNLDNEAMVDHAKDALIEDIFNAVKFDEVQDGIEIVEDATLTEEDIPDFLKEEIEA